MQSYGDGGASLIASFGAGPLLYSHLDTSLDGLPGDSVVTGRSDAAGPLRVLDGGRVEGFGLGVARAPAAAALLAFVTARRGSLLLAGSGTHRRGAHAAGVLRYLQSVSELPSAAIVAKCGPATLLWSEPGAAYLRVRVCGSYGAVLAYDSAVPAGGVIAQAGVVLAALERWRAQYLATRAPVGQLGVAAGIGAIGAGLAAKPDLFPAALELDLYVVTQPGEDVLALAEELAAQVHAGCADTPLAPCVVAVTAEPIHAAAGTEPDAPIVRAAHAAWVTEFGSPPPPITGWTGSTDGVVLRAAGIDTVRLGPQSVRSATDPRRDVLELSDLAAYTRLYAKLLRY